MFSTVSKIEVVLAMVNLLCENAFSLVWFKILSIGKGVMISLDNCQACPGTSLLLFIAFITLITNTLQQDSVFIQIMPACLVEK